MTNKALKAKTYLVGGAVRDQLLGRPVADRDWVVVGSSPDELLKLGYKQIGNEFPCFLHPETKQEYALARTERKSGSGHTGFVCDFSPDVTLEEDLVRRDLTINAIAQTASGEYIDPYGGRDDLAKGILKHVSDAFVEDPLRVLRVARFAARFAELNFKVHPETMALMTSLSHSGELDELTPERIWKEMSRALSENKPSEFFEVLRACGALKVIMPELDVLFGVPQPAEHHPEIDTGEHVMMCIDIAKQKFDNPMVTWAALVHDLGKGITPASEWPKHIKHEINGVPLVKAVSNRFRVPKDYADLGRLVAEHHLRCHRLMEMKPGKIMDLLEAVDAIRRLERLQYFAQACETDARGRLGLKNRAYPNSALLVACGELINKVDAKPLLAAGYEGLKLAEQIRQVRIKRIAAYLEKEKR
ncbi:MAG: tRNA nucleotidyltransferase (CCA-adding enzyme) [Candidatus Azotimanducaceae bacterium]|jgi:tRNA nucleotidyltransferase (CCA-adding enzyme)